LNLIFDLLRFNSLMKLKKLPVPFIYVLLVSLVLALVISLQSYTTPGREMPFLRHLLIFGINYIFWAFFTPFIYTAIHTMPKVNKLSFKWIMVQVGFSLFFTAIHLVLMNLVYALIVSQSISDMISTVSAILLGALLSREVDYWVIFSVFIAIDHYRRYRDQKLQLALVSEQLNSAKLQALQMQLNPHFLFNALHTVYALMGKDIKKARKVLSQLGDLLRAMLDQNDRYLQSLDEELSYIKNYLEIEQTRFIDRLTIQYDVDDAALKAEVPSLILQPLVENALKHGFSNNTGNGNISISVKIINQRLVIHIVDNGKGLKDVNEKGLGLQNTRKRLSQIYGSDARLALESSKTGGCISIVELPYKKIKQTEPVYAD